MARASKTDVTANVGATLVTEAFQRIGWGPIRNDWHDLGTDIYVQARDARLFDRGLFVAVQVKSGKRYFRHPRRRKGKVKGWTYYDKKQRFDDWVTHGLPHVLVLCDTKQRKSYWAHVSRKNVSDTKQGCKVFVPMGQQVRHRCLDALLTVASTQNAAMKVEGRVWHAGAESVPPTRVWRHALILPRMVMPHGNRPNRRDVRPEEAAAFAVRSRILDYERLRSTSAGSPDLASALEHGDWGWRFAGALAIRPRSAAEDHLRSLVTSAKTPERRAASTVALASALLEADGHADALVALKTCASDDDLSPVDLAWITVQAARTRAEMGKLRSARNLAAKAQKLLTGDERDLTASAVASAGADLLFSTAGWPRSKAIADVVQRADTFSSWWRSQEVAAALSRHLTDAFHAWTQRRDLTWTAEDRVSRGLDAAAATAMYTGEQSMWRHSASQLGMHLLMAGGDAEQGLTLLRTSGNSQALAMALPHIVNCGPVDAAAANANNIRSGSWTRTACIANLKCWQHAGDVMMPERADSAAALCIDVLTDPKHPLLKRVPPNFLLASGMYPALAGVLSAATPQAHVDAARFLAAALGRAEADGLEYNYVAQLGEAIDWPVVPEPALESVRVACEGRAVDWAVARILSCLARAGDTGARDKLAEYAGGGDIISLAALGDFTILEEGEAAPIIELLANRVRGTVQEASGGTISFGRTVDDGAMLAAMNLAHPGPADWDAVLALVTCPEVLAEAKATACALLARSVEELPPTTQRALCDHIDAVGACRQTELDDAGIWFEHASLSRALGLVDDEQFQGTLSELLGATDWRARRAAARLMEHDRSDAQTGVLASLLGDGAPEVRAQAARAIGRRAGGAPDHSLLLKLVQRAMSVSGRSVVASCLRGLTLAEPRPLPGPVSARIDNLLKHPSAHVRRLAIRIIERPAPPSENAPQ